MQRLILILLAGLLWSNIALTKEQAIDLCGKINPCINDFKIQGMGVGDSLLDFFNKKEIKKTKLKKYKNNKYTVMIIDGDGEFDEVWISYRSNDKKYEIAYIKGLRLIGDKEECLEEREKYKSKLLKSWAFVFMPSKSKPNQYVWGHSVLAKNRNYFWGPMGCTPDGIGGFDLFIAPQTETWSKWLRKAYIPGKS